MAENHLKKTTEAQIAEEVGSKEGISEAVLGEAEPWEAWETKLCLWSLGIGIAALVVLGFLINRFLLS